MDLDVLEAKLRAAEHDRDVYRQKLIQEIEHSAALDADRSRLLSALLTEDYPTYARIWAKYKGTSL